MLLPLCSGDEAGEFDAETEGHGFVDEGIEGHREPFLEAMVKQDKRGV